MEYTLLVVSPELSVSTIDSAWTELQPQAMWSLILHVVCM